MKLRWAILIAIGVFAALAAAVYLAPGHGTERPHGFGSKVEWQRMANPGALSQAHAFLDHNCNACHTPNKGVEAASCIVCHANDETVLQRQPTAFHADIGSCRECHGEHQGRASQITRMDHDALAKIGLRQLGGSATPDNEMTATAASLKHWIQHSSSVRPSALVNPHLSARELTLSCASCHQNDDRHFGLFGNDCSACHQSARWNLPEFRHPSASSMDCAQCHQAPPSHYMGHFKMISMTVAGQPHARVDQCFLCHQTTSWPDIKRVGWYKHH
jgi:hypothetical protein